MINNCLRSKISNVLGKLVFSLAGLGVNSKDNLTLHYGQNYFDNKVEC